MRSFRISGLRAWHTGLVVVVLAAIGAAVLFFPGDKPVPPPPSGPPGTGPITIVSMGDSSLSGEGTGQYLPGTDGQNGNWCHRSPLATVHRTSVPGIEKTVNLACSGAATAHVALTDETKYTEGSQSAQLRELTRNHRVAAVVVAVGGNDDPHFAHRLSECIKAWWGDPCTDTMANGWQATVDAMVPKLVRALADVRSVLQDAGYDRRDYQLIVQSYPSPVSPDIPEQLRNLDGCPFRVRDLRWIRDVGVPQLSDGMRRAADEAGARFLDLSRAADGHEACTGGDDPTSEWFTRLTLRMDDLGDLERASHSVQESFHSNARGHERFGACLTEFLASTDRRARCLKGDDGTLHSAPAD